VAACVCNQICCVLETVKYTNIENRRKIILLDLPFCSIASVCCAVWDWVTECVEVFVMCLLARTRDWCRWPVAHWFACCVDGGSSCKMFPSCSFACLYSMVLIALKILLRFHNHVYYLIYAKRMHMLGYWCVYNVHVLYVLWLWIFRIVRYTPKLCYRCYTLILYSTGVF
jgi:hypothetical protein